MDSVYQPPWDALLLLGPPGSGKSWLGRRLAAENIVRFLDLEPQLVARFGRDKTFVSRKAEALSYIASAWDAELSKPGPPIAIESTGLSDATNLQALRERCRVLIARLETPRDVCIARVAARPSAGQLNNDPGYAARFHDYWTAEIARQYPPDLILTDTDAAVAVLKAALTRT